MTPCARPGRRPATGRLRGLVAAASCMTASWRTAPRRRSRRPTPRLPDAAAAPAEPGGLTLVLRPDPCVWDGRFANNAWLQECPQPLTTAGLGQRRAARAGGRGSARPRARATWCGSEPRRRAALEAPVLLQPGHAPGVRRRSPSATGATRAGAIGNGIGADAYRLRARGRALDRAGRRLTPTRTRGRRAVLAHAAARSAGRARRATCCPGRRSRAGAGRAQPSRRTPGTRRASTRTVQYDGLRLGHGDRHHALHRLQRLRRRLPGREQRPGRRPGGDRARPRHALAAHRHLRPRHAASSRDRASSRCPACIARRRPASRSAPSPPRSTTARG